MRAWWATALLLLGCKTMGPSPGSPVSVKQLEVTFDSTGRGQLHLQLEVETPGEVTEAQWQLLLDGRPVGSGLQLLTQRLGAGKNLVELSAGIPVPHSKRDEGWRTVTLEVAGDLSITDRISQRWPFALRRQSLLQGAPY